MTMRFGSGWRRAVVAGLFLLVPVAGAAEPIPGVGPAGDMEEVKSGFQFTEGPAMDRDGNLYFTDIPANTIYRLSADGQLSKFTEESGHANGLMFDSQNRLLACQMDGQVVRFQADNQAEPVAAEYQGKRFNAPNDLVIDRQGGVYFTDPHFRAPEPLPQGKTCVYYVGGTGDITRLIDDLPAPNGVILSPDEKTLYVIPSGQSKMMAYNVTAPGKIAEGRVFCELKQPEGQSNTGGDGLTIDTRGNVYITSALGIQVFDPSGKYLGVIEVPQRPANCTFAGPDRKTLYITARTGLYRVPMEAQGHVFARQDTASGR